MFRNKRYANHQGRSRHLKDTYGTANIGCYRLKTIQAIGIFALGVSYSLFDISSNCYFMKKWNFENNLLMTLGFF